MRMLLHVALQDGFRGDSVQIEASGREIYRKDGITSKTQIGYADSVEVNIAGKVPEVRVTVPTRGAAESIRVPQADAVYLGVSLTRDGRIEHLISQQPFGYV